MRTKQLHHVPHPAGVRRDRQAAVQGRQRWQGHSLRLSDDQSRRGLGPESAGGIPARNTQLHNTQRRVETEKTHSSRRVVAQPLFHRRWESGQNASAADVALQCPDGRRRTVQKPVLRLPELGLERPDGGWADQTVLGDAHVPLQGPDHLCTLRGVVRSCWARHPSMKDPTGSST